MSPEPEKATDHPRRDGLVKDPLTCTVRIEEPPAATSMHAMVPTKGAMLLASLAAMSGGSLYPLSRMVWREPKGMGARITPARRERTMDETQERIAKAEAKRTRKWGGR